MAEHQFIPNDPEQILADTIATYQRNAGLKLNAADPERLVVDCMVYREMILRGQMEELMRQNFVQYATGSSLDFWAELFGLKRLEGESDESLRERILASTRGKIGTYEAYRQRILAIPGVSDIAIIRKCEDNTLPPGVVRLIPIMEQQTPELTTTGVPHDAMLETAIQGSINAVDFGIIGAVFIFQPAVPVPVNGYITVRGIVNYPREQLKKNVERRIDDYFNRLSLRFDNEFGAYDLEREVLAADGVLTGGVAVSFPNVPTKRMGEFLTKGTVNITFV